MAIYNYILLYTLVQDDYTDEMEEGEEMYSMSVKLAAANHKTSDKISLLEKRSDSATVSVDDEHWTMTWMMTRKPV